LLTESSTLIEFKDGTVAYVAVSPDGKWRVASELEDVDPAYISALIRLEDKRFWKHHGVDPVAVIRAAFKN